MRVCVVVCFALICGVLCCGYVCGLAIVDASGYCLFCFCMPFRACCFRVCGIFLFWGWGWLGCEFSSLVLRVLIVYDWYFCLVVVLTGLICVVWLVVAVYCCWV